MLLLFGRGPVSTTTLPGAQQASHHGFQPSDATTRIHGQATLTAIVVPNLIGQNSPTTSGQTLVAMILEGSLEDAIRRIGRSGVTCDAEILPAIGTSGRILESRPPSDVLAAQKQCEPTGLRKNWKVSDQGKR